MVNGQLGVRRLDQRGLHYVKSLTHSLTHKYTDGGTVNNAPITNIQNN